MPPKPSSIDEQNRSNGHCVPEILAGCDIQFGIYPSVNVYDIYCFVCGKWLVSTGAERIGYVMEMHNCEQ